MDTAGLNCASDAWVSLIRAPAALVEWRANGASIVFANSYLAEIIGVPVSDLIGHSLADCVPRYLAKQIQSGFDAYFSQRSVTDAELVIERDGAVRWWRLLLVPTASLEAECPRAVALFHEITEYKRREIEATCMAQRFRALVEFSADGIITVDQNQRVKFMNDAARQMFLVTDNNVVGWHLSRFIPERFRGSHGGFFELFRKSPIQVRPMQTRNSIAALRMDGSEFVAEITIAKIAFGTTLEFAATIRDVTQLTQRMDELQRAATHDLLTGIANRRHGILALNNEISRSRRFGHPLTLALFDLDDFKHVNDIYGHACGDDVLKSVTLAVSKTLREADVFCRWGGEEFLAILPETTVTDAIRWAERVRDTLASNVATCEAGQAITITASFGLAAHSPLDAGPEAVLKRADDAMYRAKREGRNQIVVAE